MKSVVAVVVLAVVAIVAADDIIKLSAEQKAKAEGIAKECVKETGANGDIVRAMVAGDFSMVGDKEKCLTKCMQEKLGYISGGVVQENVIQKSLGPIAGDDIVKGIQAKCNGLKGANDCETAFERQKCYYNEKASLAA